MKQFLLTFLLFSSLAIQAQDRTRFQKIDSILNPFIQPNAPGFSLGIVENGKVIYQKGIGLANLTSKTSNSDSSIFSIASVAKQFTAACIWSLIQENKISLDDDIRTLIPEFPNYGTPIRIRHMLNHTSGIRNYQALMDLAGFQYDKEFHDNQTILALASRQKGLNNIPGEKVIYGNTAYTLLALIIERISGENLNEYAKKKLFLPLKMTHTFYRTSATMTVPNRSIGYVQEEDGSYLHPESNQITYGAGSVGSSIEDLAKWSTMLNGLIPEYKSLSDFLTTCETLPSGENATYARGVMVDKYKSVKTIHHSGYGIGGQSQVIAIPELKLAVIILTNLETIDPTPLSYQLLDLFLIATKVVEPQHQNSIKYSKVELTKYIGNYQEQNSDMKMEILFENDTLKSLIGKGRKAIPLISFENGKFIRSNNASVQYDFINSPKSNADLIVYFGGTPFYFSKAHFINEKEINLSDYIGRYHSDELAVDYFITIENNALLVSYANDIKMKLSAGQKDEFGNGQRRLFHFERDVNNNVVKLLLSAEGTVKNIEFVKLK